MITASHRVRWLTRILGFGAAILSATSTLTETSRLEEVTFASEQIDLPAYTYVDNGNYFPLFRGDDQQWTGFAVTNYADQTTDITLTAFGTDGKPLPLPNNPRQLRLEGKEQFAQLGRELFGAAPNVPCWVELESTHPVTSTFLFGNSSTDRLDGANSFRQTYPQLYFTRIYEGEKGFRGERDCSARRSSNSSTPTSPVGT